MSIKASLQDAVKAAMRNKDKDTLGTLRMTMAAIKQKEVDERIELDDATIIALLDKMIKQRRDAIEQYNKGNRPELAAKEATEIEVLQTFLPQPLSETEIDQLIAAAITDTSAAVMADMGKVMGQLKPTLQGRADMGKVSQIIRKKLS